MSICVDGMLVSLTCVWQKFGKMILVMIHFKLHLSNGVQYFKPNSRGYNQCRNDPPHIKLRTLSTAQNFKPNFRSYKFFGESSPPPSSSSYTQNREIKYFLLNFKSYNFPELQTRYSWLWQLQISFASPVVIIRSSGLSNCRNFNRFI